MKMRLYQAFFIAAACTALPGQVSAYGEGGDIPKNSRAIHLIVNEYRTAPHETLNACPAGSVTEGIRCYSNELAPLYWSDPLYRAAQMHAVMTSEVCMMHSSPCTLVSNIASLFPDKCDGKVACACEGGIASCQNTQGTKTFDRIHMFTGGDGWAENIASVSEPVMASDMWICEKGSADGLCESNSSNGHRWNILNSQYKVIGIGTDRTAVQDFGNKIIESSPISSGFYYTKGNDLWFKLQYYAEAEAAKARVNVRNECIGLTKTAGSASNGVYGISLMKPDDTCVAFAFEVKDSTGKVTRYPSTGSLLYECGDKTWQPEEVFSCFGTDDNPGTGGSGSGTDNPGTGGSGSGTDNPGTGGSGSGTDNPGTGGSGSGTDNPGTGGSGSGTDNPGTGGSGSGTDNPGTGGSGSGTDNPGTGNTGSDGDSSDAADSCSAQPLRASASGTAALLMLLLGGTVFARRRRVKE